MIQTAGQILHWRRFSRYRSYGAAGIFLTAQR
jgi:hypothetical protein